MSVRTRQQMRKRRHNRIRRRISGTAEQPRLAVMVSQKHMYAQLIDDEAGVTLAAVSTHGTEGGNSVAKATELGKGLGAQASEKGIKEAVLDRGGFSYAGRVKALTEAAREAGLKI